MRYEEYIQLKNIVQNNQYSTINEDANSSDSDDINTDLKTFNSGVNTWYNPFNFNPNAAIKKKIIDSKAKKLQNNLVKKFIKPIIENYFKNSKTLYTEISKYQNSNQTPEVKDAIDKMININNKVLQEIEATTKKAIDTNTQNVNSEINNYNIKDSNKNLLKTYWILLSSQVQLNCKQFFYNQLKNFVKQNGISNKIVEPTFKIIDNNIKENESTVQANKTKVSEEGKNVNANDTDATDNNQNQEVTNKTASNQNITKSD